MSIGMSYDEFWNQDVALVGVYLKAQELRDKRRNQELWLQGMYVYEALCDASPLFRFSMKKGAVKPEPYAREPYPITAAEAREREQRKQMEKQAKLKAEFAAFVDAMKKRQMPQEAHPEIRGGETNEYHD